MSFIKTVDEEKRYVQLLRDWMNAAFDRAEGAIKRRRLKEAEDEMTNLAWLVGEIHESGLRLRRLRKALERDHIRKSWSGFHC